MIARGVFTNVEDVDKKLMRYIRQYNKNPKPISKTNQVEVRQPEQENQVQFVWSIRLVAHQLLHQCANNIQPRRFGTTGERNHPKPRCGVDRGLQDELDQIGCSRANGY